MIYLFIACIGSPNSLTSADTGNSSSNSASVPPPSLTLDQYIDQLEQAFSFGIPDADEARRRYFEWRSYGDSLCPGAGFQLQGIIEPCTASSGYTFSGMAGVIGSTTDLVLPDSFEIGADCYILSPSNDRFVGAGDLIYSSTGDNTNGEITSTVRGTWESPPDTDWMGTDNSIWLTQNLSWVDVSNWLLTYQGGYHLNDSAIQFDPFTIGSTCQGGMGTLSVRDPNGYWMTIDLGEDCTGCGQATYMDTDLGQVCLDLFAIFELEYQQQYLF